MRIIICAAFAMLMLVSCQETETVLSEGSLKVYLQRDPEKLNPVFNPKANAREVYQNIFVPLADYHPESLALYPILIEEVPAGEMINDSIIRYTMTFKEDAVWADGKPITGHDYAFTMKAIMHPIVNTPSWRSLISYVKSVNVDEKNPRTFSVDMDQSNMLSKEIATTNYILPKHVYDAKGILDDKNLSYFSQQGIEESVVADSSLVEFASSFNDPVNYRSKLVSAGPYMLDTWESDQYIILKKNKDYWGDNYPENPFLQGYPEEIVFKIFADELTAYTNFKNDGMDVMKFRSSSYFLALKDSSETATKYNFETPQLMRYYYIALNNRKKGLDDPKVRRALAHAMDVDALINIIEKEYGSRSTGPIHPSKPYYNTALKPIQKDIEQAKKLLAEAGWTDSDNDNILDKDAHNLSFDLLASPSELAQQVSLVFKEGCKQIGAEINIVQKSPRVFVRENVNTFEYDMAALAQTLDANPDDPSYRWHSSNAALGGSNITGYTNPENDAVIDEILSTKDEARRTQLYKDFQQMLYDDQAALFLYSPTEKIAIHSSWEGKGTSKRPGYLLNTFKKKSN